MTRLKPDVKNATGFLYVHMVESNTYAKTVMEVVFANITNLNIDVKIVVEVKSVNIIMLE